MDIPISFTSIIILFFEAFKYDDGAKFCGYDETNAKPLYAEFCHFVQLTFLKLINLLQNAIKVVSLLVSKTSCIIIQQSTFIWPSWSLPFRYSDENHTSTHTHSQPILSSMS
jgi:hypothetical protein